MNKIIAYKNNKLNLPSTINGLPNNIIGKKIFDLSIVISLQHISLFKDLFKDLKNVKNLHILPQDQLHLTFINPVFLDFTKPSSQRLNPEKQIELWQKLNKFMEDLFWQQITFPLEITIDQILIRPHDIKFICDNNSIKLLKNCQELISSKLKTIDPNFDFPEGTPFPGITIARFKSNFNNEDLKGTIKILDVYTKQLPLKITLSKDLFLAVMFKSLFLPWDADSSLTQKEKK